MKTTRRATTLGDVPGAQFALFRRLERRDAAARQKLTAAPRRNNAIRRWLRAAFGI